MTLKDNQEDNSFKVLVQTLSLTAFQQFGQVNDPVYGDTGIDLDQAELTYSMLKSLKLKTKGNLAGDELVFLDKMLEKIEEIKLKVTSDKSIDQDSEQLDINELTD